MSPPALIDELEIDHRRSRREVIGREVRLGLAVDVVLAAAGDNDVVFGAAVDSIVGLCAVGIVGEDPVVAVAAIEPVAAIAAIELIVVVTAEDQVATVAAVKEILLAEAVDAVVAAVTPDVVDADVAEQALAPIRTFYSLCHDPPRQISDADANQSPRA